MSVLLPGKLKEDGPAIELRKAFNQLRDYLQSITLLQAPGISLKRTTRGTIVRALGTSSKTEIEPKLEKVVIREVGNDWLRVRDWDDLGVSDGAGGATFSTSRYIGKPYNLRKSTWPEGSKTPGYVIVDQFTGVQTFDLDVEINEDGTRRDLVRDAVAGVSPKLVYPQRVDPPYIAETDFPITETADPRSVLYVFRVNYTVQDAMDADDVTYDLRDPDGEFVIWHDANIDGRKWGDNVRPAKIWRDGVLRDAMLNAGPEVAL